MNRFSMVFQRGVGGFEYLHHAQTSRTIIKRSLIVLHTVDKVSRLCSQSLGLFDLWRPHIARAVADQQLVDARPTLYVDSFVVNFDLFVGVKIVPNEHLLLPP